MRLILVVLCVIACCAAARGAHAESNDLHGDIAITIMGARDVWVSTPAGERDSLYHSSRRGSGDIALSSQEFGSGQESLLVVHIWRPVNGVYLVGTTATGGHLDVNARLDCRGEDRTCEGELEDGRSGELYVWELHVKRGGLFSKCRVSVKLSQRLVR